MSDLLGGIVSVQPFASTVSGVVYVDVGQFTSAEQREVVAFAGDTWIIFYLGRPYPTAGSTTGVVAEPGFHRGGTTMEVWGFEASALRQAGLVQ